jgi:CrcB protein
VSIRLALLVTLCGGLGSLLRWLLSNALTPRVEGFPAGTLTVNLLGSLAIGFVMEVSAARGSLAAPTRIAVTAGLLGGFTTFSAFAWETWQLLDARQTLRATAYLSLTLVLGLAACFAGVLIARILTR